MRQQKNIDQIRINLTDTLQYLALFLITLKIDLDQY